MYEQFGLFDPKYKIAGDFEFIARVFKGSTIAYHYFPEVMIKMQAGGLSNRGLKSNILINREIKIACIDNGIRTNDLNLLLRYPRKLLEWIL